MSNSPPPRPAGADADPHPDIPIDPLPPHWRSLGHLFVHRVRTRGASPAMSDSTGVTLTYAEAFLRSVALGRALDRLVGPARFVGVMIPPSVPAAVANMALTLRGKAPVNLNYTASQAAVDAAVDQCKITHVLTSRKVVERTKIRPKGEVVLLEDVAKAVSKLDKAVAFAAARLTPSAILPRLLPGLRIPDREETATIVFTSGSTGEPKGVVLSHRNVLSNVLQFRQVVPLNEDEVVLGILPFFHSFGFTVTIWTVLGLGYHGIYHVDPTDARIIGKLVEDHKVTILFASPTFMRGMARRCTAEQFRTVRMPILGAEKLKPELAAEIRGKLEIEPLEGYGCTETGPVVAVNIPGEVSLADGRRLVGNKPGSVGLVLPGTAIRVADPETGRPLARGEAGIVHVRGPQVMAGYLDRPEATAKVLRDGWYDTGDLGMLDDDGFLTITDRLSRFSKIGGEMVPHMGVEAAIQGVVDASHEGAFAVTSIPDPRRGERLVVVFADPAIVPGEVSRRLAACPIPRLWVPGPDDFVRVDALPVSGTKLDLRGLRAVAADALLRCGGDAEAGADARRAGADDPRINS